MEEPYQLQSTVKGKDLPGAVKVMPMGLDAAIKKRVSGEFKSEQRGSALSFSHAGDKSSSQQLSSSSQQMSSSSQQMSSSSQQVGLTQQTAVKQEKTSAMKKETSSMMSSSSSSQKMMSSSSSQKMMSSSSSSQKMTSSSALTESQNFMSSNSEVKQMSSLTSQSTSGHKSEAMFSQLGSTHQQDFQSAIASSQQQQHGEEIKQENLKTQIVSAITDLEKEIVVDFDNKENIPGQVKSPTPVKQDIFSPPPLEIMEPPKPVPMTVERGFDIHAVNGDFNSLDVKKISKASELHQIEEYNETALTNGSYQESQSLTQAEEYHEDGSMLQKIMRPAPTEFDSGSLKRRDPRKMFTDSSFYSAKHHPTVADQVEMAHRISSALFQEDNKMSKGQNMYLNRAKRSGEVAEDLEVTHPRHDKVPNLKLVMNPEGKVQEWDDIAPEDQPDMSHVATHAAAPISLPSPDIAEAAAGKGGELFAKRRKKAENWVVDEDSVGQSKPSNFADKFMQQQMFQQQQFQQQQQIEQQQKQQIQQQQVQHQQIETSRQQQESRQQFQQQQQIKQEQSLEIRRQQEAETIMNSMNSQQMDLPANFQHFSLKGRSYTPAFDTSCHNVQGINVWANSAPRGWASQGTAQRVPIASSAPKSGGPPVVAVCPATPSSEQQQQAALAQQQEEAVRLHQEQQEIMIRQQREEEALLLQRQQEEQLIQQRQQEEQLIQQRQQEEQLMQQRQHEEMIRIQQEEQTRIRVQQEEQERIHRQQEEQERIRIEAQRMAEMQRQEEEARRQQQILEQQKAAELMQQQQAAESLRQQQEAERIQQQQAEELRKQQEIALKQQQQQVAIQQQQAMMQQQQAMQQQQMSSSISSTRVEKTTASSEDLEWQKRKEYEDWFKNQEKEALEYSAVCEYQEKAGESREVTTKTTTTSTRESHLTRQQHQTQGILSSTGAAPPLTREAQHGKPPTPGPLTHTNQTHSQHTDIKQQSSSSMTQQSSSFSHMEGVIKGQDYSRDQRIEDYTGSLQPTTTGDIIRQGGDVVYSKARSESGEPGKSPLRQTPAGQNIRDSGIFGGITGDKNSLVEGSDEIDYTKHTVKQLASHFSKVKPPTEIPDKYLPQQHLQSGAQLPSFNYLQKQEANSSSSSITKTKIQTQQTSQSTMKVESVESKAEQTQKKEEKQQANSSQRRQSLKDALLMDPAAEHIKAGFIDPSSILRDSDATLGKSDGILRQSSVEGENLTNKWDNHNTIARGWEGMKANYHPVTFREIYNVESQVNKDCHNL